MAAATAGANLDRPKLESFVNVSDGPQSSVLERNPYYCCVDPGGQPAPYIDKIINDKAADLSILDAKTVGGNYDFACFELRILSYTTYAEGAAASDAHMTLWQSGKGRGGLQRQLHLGRRRVARRVPR